MKLLVHLCVVFLLALASCTRAAEPGVAAKGEATTLAMITSDSPVERKKGEKRLLAARAGSIAKLIRVVEEERKFAEFILPDSKRHFAIRALGALRAAEAVKPLMDRIGLVFQAPHGTRGLVPWSAEVEALIKIGKPASKAAVAKLATESDEDNRKLLAGVVRGVEGLEVGRFMLERKIKTTSGKKEKANLQAALEYFKPEKAKEKPKKAP